MDISVDGRYPAFISGAISKTINLPNEALWKISPTLTC